MHRGEKNQKVHVRRTCKSTEKKKRGKSGEAKGVGLFSVDRAILRKSKGVIKEKGHSGLSGE